MAEASSLLEPPSNAVKKARRQTSFYPIVNSTNKPSKPFSRSAAKRESVLALGSIEHLQHFFTKTGLAAKQKPAEGLKRKGYVLAIGGHAKTPSVTSTGVPEIRFDLPPSPAVPAPPRKPFDEFVKSHGTDPDEILPELVKDLEGVSAIWALGTSEQRVVQQPADYSSDGGSARVESPTPTPASRAVMLSPLDVLAVLKSTTAAIRSVRNYLVTLPDDYDYSPPSPNAFRSPSLSPSNKPVPLPQQTNDSPLNLIRGSALEVLGVLRDIEEKYRMPQTEEISDALSDQGSVSLSRVPSPGSDDSESGTSFAVSVIKSMGIEKEILVYSEEEEDFNKQPEEKKETWDERLVLGGGWLYRQNVTLLDLEKERETVAHYLDTVDQLIFGGETPLRQRGWAFALQRLRARQRRSTNSSPIHGDEIKAGHVRGHRMISAGLLDAMKGMVVSEDTEEEIQSPLTQEEWDEDHLPDWAKATCFVDDLLGRALALLHHLLPTELAHLLPQADLPADRNTLLLALSSGQLLCVAYNTGIRRSKKPWGYINKSAIHDIAALELEALTKNPENESDGKKRTWTFRRTENLRLWAAAVKLRYMVPLVSTSQLNGTSSQSNTPLPSPSAATIAFHQVSPPTLFDAPIIAKREEHWDDMLEAALFKWVEAIVNEKRAE